MSFNDKPLIEAYGQETAPQYYNQSADQYEVVRGQNGAVLNQLVNTTGTPIDPVTLAKFQDLLTIITTVYDSVNGVLKTSGSGEGGASGTVDISDDAARVLGKITVDDGGIAVLGSVNDAVVAAGADGTASAKLKRLTTDLSALITLNTTLNGKDFATQTTLTSAKTVLDSIYSVLNTEDFAHETTLATLTKETTLNDLKTILTDVYDSTNHLLKTTTGGGGTSSTVDVTDRSNRVLGSVTLSAAADVSDRTGRSLGVVSRKGIKSITQDSTANTTNTVTLSAIASTKYKIYGYQIIVSGAAVASNIAVTLTDNATVVWKDFIGIGTSIGSGAGVIFNSPIEATAVNTAFIVSATAGGASVITTINILYDTITG
ncbi:MAG: hypothetical protein Q8910_00415 [Bacteroidota bacterium]|nr:hypothetical protein [Bacteroidota bacterium]